MDYNILIGGAAGQGMETMASMLEKILQRKGFEVFSVRDYMSRVRGGHNFIQVRFGNEKLTSHREKLDAIVALNQETIEIHKSRLSDKGFVLCDEEIRAEDPRVVRLPLKAAAKQAGNPKTMGSAALGAVIKLAGLNMEAVEGALSVFFQGDVAAQNMAAQQAGFGLVAEPGFHALPAGGTGKSLLINGNQAIALGALAAGCKFYSAYPMTPSTSIMNYLASKMEEAEIIVEQAEDEIAAINMAIGASYAGVRAMTGTSGGGFALMVEAMGLSAMQEVPLVIANIQRPGPTTGLPTRTEQADLKFIVHGVPGEIPRMVMAARTPEDAFYQTVRAFNLADKYQIPVVILGDQFLADSTVTVSPFDFNRVKVERHLTDAEALGEREYLRYEVTESGVSPRIIPGKIPGKTVLVDSDEHDETGHITESAEVRVKMNDKRLRKIEFLSRELLEPEYIGEENAEVLLVAWGSMYGPLSEAVKLLNESGGRRYGALVFGDLWPLPQKQLLEKAPKAQQIINVEQNATGQLASLIREVTGISCHFSILKYDGRPFGSFEIVERLKGGQSA